MFESWLLLVDLKMEPTENGFNSSRGQSQSGLFMDGKRDQRLESSSV
jgi:hypothetical protein